ncbi:MAG: hypothetical protein ACYS47_19315 [Planctomycetota bacterium]
MSACVNCGADLVDSPLYDEEGEDLAAFEAVFVGPMAVAFEIKTHLDNQGFPVYLQGAEEGHGVVSDPADRTGIVRILVPIESADTATEIIEGLTAKEKSKPVEVGLPVVDEESFLGDGFEGEDSLEAGDEDLADPGIFGESDPDETGVPSRKPARKKSGKKAPTRKKAAPRTAPAGKKDRADRKKRGTKKTPRSRSTEKKSGGKKRNRTRRVDGS